MNLRDLAGDQLAQTGLGLAIGTMARYAMRIQDRLPIGPREIVADILLLGINAVLTLFVIERLGATGKGAVLTAALFGIAQDRVIRVLRRRMEKRAAAIEAALFGEEGAAEARRVSSAPVMLPEPVEPLSPREQKPSDIGDHLRRTYRSTTRSPPLDDQIALLRKLDKEPDL